MTTILLPTTQSLRPFGCFLSRTLWVGSILVLTTTAAASQAIPQNTQITLQRGGCEKRCAVYKIVIFADGTLLYHGQYYVRKRGVVLDKVDVAAIRKLVDDFQSINYFNLEDQDDYGKT